MKPNRYPRLASAAVAFLLVAGVLRAAECLPSPEGLVSWYRGGGAADDAVGGHHGLVAGGVSFDLAFVGQGMRFDGSSGSITLGSWFDRQSFSVAFWARPGGSQQDNADIIDNNHRADTSWVVQQDGGALNRYVWGRADGAPGIQFTLPADVWTFVVLTRTSDHVNQVYLDGVLVGTETGTTPIRYDGGQVLRLGQWGGGGRYWNGQLDEVDVYDRPLSAETILALHAAGAAGKCPGTSPTPAVPYFTSFETGMGPEWSIDSWETSQEPNFTRFTGRFNNHSQTLTLTGFEPGKDYTATFDLYIIDSWDGTSSPDRFQVLVNGQALFDETFSNYNGDPPGNPQSFARQPDTGRVHLGFHGSYVDAIYRNIEIPFVAVGESVQVTFRGVNIQDISDESWGLDNVSVQPTSTLAATYVRGTSLPDDGSTSGLALDRFEAYFSRDLRANSASDPANFTLREAGADGLLGTGDDGTLDLLVTTLSSRALAFSFNDAPLQPGLYRFEIKASLLDGAGNAVAPFQRSFRVANPALGRLENTFNNQLETATPLTPVETPAGSGFLTTAGLGSFAAGGDTDYWRFNAEAGDVISARVETASYGVYPQIYLQNSSGSNLSASGEWQPYHNYLQAVTISQPGTYYVAVAAAPGRSRGAYTLRLDISRGRQLEVEDNNAMAQANSVAFRITPGIFSGKWAGCLTTPEGPADYFRLTRLNIGNSVNVSLALPSCSSLAIEDVVLTLELEGVGPVATNTAALLTYVVNTEGVYFLKATTAKPGWRAQYTLDVTIADGTNPSITSLSLPAEGSSGQDLIDQFNVGFSEDMTPRLSLVGRRTVTFQGHYYSVTPTALPWWQAEDEAVAMGGHLVSINSQAENEMLVREFGAFMNFWIGFTDQTQEGTWVWTSGDLPEFAFWNPGEPNNSGGEHYAEMQAGGRWNDVGGSSPRRGVMEFAGGSDADGDGQPDATDPFPSDPLNGFDLRAAGADGQWNTADDVVYAVESVGYASGLSASFRIKDGPLQPGAYRLTITTAVQDVVGNGLAANVVRHFTVQGVPGFVNENRSNQSIAVATPLGGILNGPADGTYTPLTSYGVGPNPYHILAASLNSDSTLDWISSDINDAGIRIGLGDGRGGFTNLTRYAVGSGPISTEVGDFNGDGVLDIAVANHYAHTVGILLARSGGGYEDVAAYPVGANPRRLVVADFNRDGKLDVASACSGANVVSLLLGASDGTFAAAVNFPSGSGTYGMAAGDFNADGKLDLAVAASSGPAISVLIGDGAGLFAAPVPVAVGPNPRMVIASDVTGDSVLDLLVLNAGDNTLGVLPGRGDGTFAPQTTFAIGVADPYDMVLADVDGDGTKDLVVAGYGSSRISVLKGDNAGAYRLSGTFYLPGNPISVASGEFTGDGVLDLAVACHNSSSAYLVRGNRPSVMAEDPPGSGFRTAAGRGKLADTGDVDYWQFKGEAGDTLSVAVEIPGYPGASQLYYRVEHADGTTLTDFYASSYNGWGQSAPTSLPYSGTYYLRVSYNYDYRGEYRVRITTVKPSIQWEREDNNWLTQANGLSLTLDADKLSGSVGGYIGGYDGNGDFFALGNLAAGTRVTLRERQPSTSGIVPELSVFNAAGIMVARSAPGQPTASFTLGTGDDGAYYARAFAIRPGVVRLDGIDDRVYAGYWNAGPQWTIEAWVKPSAIPAGRRSIAGGYNECKDWGITMQDGEFGVSTRQPGGCTQTTRSGEPVILDRWYHVVGTCDGTVARLYIDGVLKGTAEVEPGYVGTTSYFVIGSESCCGASSFPGDIDQVRVWSRALVDAEVAVHAADRAALLTGREPGLAANWTFDEGWAGIAWDLSPNGFNGTLQNGASFVPDDASVGYPSLVSQYLLDVEVADSTSPRILRDSWPAEASTNRIILDRFTLRFSEDMLPASVTNPATYVLLSAGADGSFGTSDDLPYAIVCDGYAAGLDASYRVADGPLQAGLYRFVVRTALKDRGGNGLAEDYQRTFTIEDVPGFVLENRSNGGAVAATSLSIRPAASPDGSFAASTSKSIGQNPYHIIARDLDGNGKLDLVTANISSANLSVLMGNEDGSFQDALSVATAGGPIAVAAGDVNADGKVDLVSANHYASSASVLLGNGDGTFRDAVSYATGANPRMVQIGDVNGDGAPDVVTANTSSGNVSVLLGAGDGTFARATQFPCGGEPFGLAVADLNGDGRADLVTANQAPGAMHVLIGNGDGTFGAPTSYSSGSGCRDLALGDMDGDGKVDAVVLNAYANSVSILRGNGDGTFAAAIPYPTNGGDPYHLVLCEVNGDARPDVAVGSYGSSRMIVLTNKGDGTLGTAAHYYTPGNPIAVAAGDYNGDGRTDLATANHNGNLIWVWFGNPTQPLAEDPSGSGVRSGFGRGMVADGNDVDYWRFSAEAGDRLTLAMDVPGNPGASSLYFRVDYADGTYISDGTTAYNGYGQSAPIVLPVAGTYTVRVSFNYGFTGEYRLRTTLARPPVQIETEDNNSVTQANAPLLTLDGSHQRATMLAYVSVADSSGDFFKLGNLAGGTGIKLDLRLPSTSGLVPVLVIYRSSGASVTNSEPGQTSLSWNILRGEEDTYFASVRPSEGLSGGLLSQYILDIDVADTEAPAIVTVTLPEEGTTSTAMWDRFSVSFSEDMTASTVTSSSGYDLRAAGPDGQFDTADDLSYGVNCTGYTSGLSASYMIADGPLQAGVCRFTVRTTLQDRAGNALAAAYVRTFTIGGVPGFIAENRSNTAPTRATSLSLQPGQTPSGSVSATASYAAGTNPYHVATGDLNQDGHADLVVAEISSSTLTVLLGRGDGTFAPGVPYASGSGPIAVAVGDVNGDQRADLVGANYYGSSMTVYLGAGDGTFSGRQDYATAANPRQVRAVDINGDGRADVVAASSSSSVVSVLIAGADGTLGARTDYPTGPECWGVFAGDLNGDGKTDLVSANQGSDRISVLLGNGDGSFGAAVDYAAGDGPREVVMGDMNGDGRLDAVVLNAYANSVSVLLGNGDGTMNLAQSYPTGGGDPYHMVLVDIDGDGRLDPAIGSYGSSRLITFLTATDGSLGRRSHYSVGGNPIAVAGADFNEDGRMDLATANHVGNSVTVLLGDRTEELLESSSAAGLRLGFGRGNVTDGSDIDYWSFSAKSGDRVNVAIEIPGNPGASSLYVRLDYPDGTYFTDFGAAYTGYGQSAPVVITSPGTYRVRVSFNYGYTGEYRLRVAVTAAGTQIESEDNDWITRANGLEFADSGHSRNATVAGAIGVWESADFFSLGNLSTGTTIQLGQRQPASSGFAPVLRVFNSAGAAVATGVVGSPRLDWTIPTNDAYYASLAYAVGPGVQHPGGAGISLSFDGADDYLEVPIDVPESAMTVSLWFKTTSPNVGLFSVVGPGHDRHIFLSGGNLAARIYSSDTIVSSGLNLADGKWHQAVLTYGPDISGTGLYVDGALVASSSKSNSDFTSQTGIRIGYAEDAPQRWFYGSMDDVRIWDRAFSAADVLAGVGTPLTGSEPGLLGWWKLSDGAGGVALDSSPGGRHATLVNGPLWAAGGTDASVTRGLQANYLLDIRMEDNSGPTIKSVTLPAEGAITSLVSPWFTVGFSEDMQAATVNSASTYDLRGAGFDRTFDTADDVAYTVVPQGYTTGLTSGFTVPDGPLQPDAYRFTIKTSLMDRFGNALAAPYMRRFSVENVERFALEGRTNGSHATSTTISAAPGPQGSGSFGYQGTLATGSTPYHIVRADLNKDGHQDVVVANYGSSSVTIYLGRGDGSFSAAPTLSCGGNAMHLAVGDYDKDGAVDIAAANWASSDVWVFPGNGDGTFQTAARYPVGTNPNGVESADLNGDGWLDLVSADRSSRSISVLLNQGDGTFGPRTPFTSGNGASRLALADLNGDGKLDAATSDYYDSTYSVLLGNGDGTFQAAEIKSLGGSPYDVQAADFNRDGKLDLVFALIAEGRVTVLLGNGDGTFGPRVDFGSGGSQPHYVEVADLNGDGFADLLASNYASSRVGVLYGNGDATFMPVLSFPSGGNVLCTASGDFNEDGRSDFVSMNYGSGDLYVFTGDVAQPLPQDGIAGVKIAGGRGQLFDGSDLDYFSFSGNAGDTILLAVDIPGNPGASSLYYRIEYPDGSSLYEFASAYTGAGQSPPITLPITSTYWVRVSFNYGYQGEYRFRVYSVRPPVGLESEENGSIGQANPLSFTATGETRSASAVGYIRYDGDLDYFNLGTITNGSTVFLSARSTSGSPLAPIVSLYDASNGYLVEAGTGRPFDGVSEVRFNRTGGCYAVVRGPDGTAGLGSSYQLDVQVVPTGSVSFPNLVVTEVTPPSGLGIRSGQPINFSYRVENAGTVGTGGSGWIDRILLTANQIVGDADDIQIGVVQRNEGLASGTGYAAESSAVIPEGIAGTFYLAVQTDFGDAVNELVLEGDNTTFSENTFTVTRPPYADLKIEGLTVTGPDASGTYSIGWTTANRGTASASGGFVERLLVRNQTAGVILVNTDRPVAGDLAPNATLAGSANVTTTTPGIYQVVVLTDAQNRIFEYDVNGHVSAEQNSAEAGFEITQLFTILLRSSPSEGGSVAGGGTFPLGSTVTVSATADAGVLPYRFQNWTEGGVFQSGQASYAFTVTRDRTLTANFALPVYQISVANEPASGGFVTGPGAYVHGAAVTLQAHAGAGYLFTNWTESGTVVGTAPQLAFQAAGTRSLVAHYMEANTFHDVTLVTEPSGIATLAGAGRYLNGQSLQVIAPASVTNPPSIYTFKHLRQNNTVVSSQPSYRKTFTTADTTNVTFTAVYDTRSIAPVIVNAIGGVSNAALARIVSQELVPISTNYQVLVQFDRGMDPAVTPQFVISNLTAGAAQAVVPPGGTWSRTLAPNDTFVCPQVVFSAAMDGRHEVWVSAAADPSGVPVEPVRVVSFVMDGIAPQHPALALAEFNNSTARVAWDAYAAAADLDGFRVFLQPAPFSNVTGLAPLTRVDASARSYVFSGLELEKDYYAAMVAVDRAGNFNPAATALTVRLASTLPPPVALQVTPSGADAAHLDWSGYDTSALVGFAGFRLYFEEHPFSSVAGLPVRGTFGPGQRIADLSGFVRSLRYSIAIVGFNRNGEFNPNVTAATWSDPYGGNISVDTVMGGPGQVIELFNPATVVNGATLTVRAGTTLRVAPEIGLRVQQGRIHVEGTALDPVVFTSYFENDLGDTPSPGDWSGITLEPGASGSVLRHAVVRYGRGLTVNGASITLDAFTATRNQGAGLTASQGAVLRTTEALLTFNDIGARQTDNARLTIEGSVFKNNGMHARGDGTETLAATGNWWGTPNEAEIAPLVAGAVTRSQPLVSEPILTPAIGIAGGESTVGRRDIVLRLASRTAEDMRVSEDSAYRGTFFGTFTKTLPFTLSEGAGQKMVYAQFRSVTGHTNTPVALALTYITAGPVIESFSLAEGQTISRPIQVTAQATALLGMQAIEFHWDGSLVLSQPGSTLTTLFDTRLQNDGIHRVKVLARDQSGNIATLERNVVIQVTPPPAPVITMPAADGTVTTPSLTVAGTAEPHLSVRLSRNGLTAGNAVASAAGQVTFSNVTLTEGVNELVIVASDGSGTTRSAPREILLDSGAPAALVLQTPVYRPGQGLEVGWHFAPEGERPLRFRVLWHSTSFSDPAQASGQSAIIDRMSTTLQGLPNGRYFFGVVGYDGAGNASAVSNVIPFTLDTTAPGFQVAYDKASPVGVGSVAITLTADEVLGAVPGLVVRAADGNPISVFLTPDGNNGYTGVFTVTPGMPSGPARVVVSARDVSGNESSGEPAGPELVLDTTPATGGIVTVPAGPVQCMEPAEVAVTLTLTEAPKPGTKPTLRFAPPTGDPVEIALAGAALHWTGILTLQPGMGSGFGNFQLAVLDAVDNSGSILTAGATLEIYHTLVPSAPAEPIGLAARSLPGGRVQLTWERVGNAESYRLYREPGTQGAPGVMVSDNITSLVLIDTPEQDGTYRYAVSAERRGAESTHARVVVAASDRTPPEAPADLQAVLAAAGVRITWRQPAGDAPREFRLYRNDMLIRTMTGVAPVFDSPPRGIANYVVAAVDEIGNESRSAPATLELLVGAVSDLTVLVNSGQAPAISWISSDPTATGFNVYRNGAKLNAVPLAETSFTDAGTAGFAVLQYAVRAVNAEGQESPARAVDVYRVSLALSPNPTAAGNDAPVTRYFDLMRVGVTHAGSEGALPLREIQVRRVAGATELSLTQPIGQGLAPGATLTREVVFPSAQTQQAQSFRMRAVQETDLGGSTVIYQGIFDVPGAVSPSLMAEIVANDQPLAGGLASFDVRLHNRGYAEMDVVLTRNNGQNPGDVYVSVRDGSGAEVSRAYFNGGVPGMSVLPDGTGFIRIRPGASARVTVTRVLVPEALASAPSVAFEGGTDKIYWHLGGAGQMDSGPVLGTMNTSLRQTDYYGTLETDRRSYADDMPIVLTGRAINRATGQPVPNAALRIGFTMRGFTWYRAVSTDESGSYRHVYTPASGISGTFTFWSAHPEVFDLLNQAEATLHRMYSNPSYGDIRMSKNDHLDFGVTLINPGDLTLENVTTSVRVFQVSGGVETPISTVQGTNLTEGVITLGPHESRGITLRLNAAIDAPDSCVAEFILASAEGAHASFRGAISLLPAVPVLTVAEPASGYVEVSLDRGALVSRNVTIVNNGLREMQGVEVVPPPNVRWMQVNLPQSADGRLRLPDMAVGDSQTFSVVFTPPADVAMDNYHDVITLKGSNTTQEFPVHLYALVTSAQRGSVQFFVDNILGQIVPNATVRLRNTLLQTELPPVLTDERGLVTIDSLQEGRWSWQVNAPGHSSSVGTVEIVPDQTQHVTTRLSKSLVTVTFRVEPVPYTDRYEIRIEQTFETRIPAPVLVLDPVNVHYDNVHTGFDTNFVVTGRNQGLIEMQDVEIRPASAGGGQLIPLITYFPVLRPQETIEIPYRTVYLGPDDGVTVETQCGSGGFVGISRDVIAMQSVVSAQYRLVTDSSMVTTAQGVWVSLAIYRTITAVVRPIEFFSSMASCFAQQVSGGNYGGGGSFGGGGGGGGGYSGPTPHTFADFTFTGPECFAAGTLVTMSDGTRKAIEDIRVNDVVRSGSRSGENSAVTEVYTKTAAKARALSFQPLMGAAREEELLTTDEHLFWVDGRGWVEARNLKAGEWLITESGSRAELKSNETRAGPIRFHTLRAHEHHAFYANGILVHDLCGRWENQASRPQMAGQEVRP